MCFFGHSIGNYHWPSPQSAQKHPSPNPNTNPSPRPLETNHSPLLAGPFSLRLGLAADNPMAPTFPLFSWAALGRGHNFWNVLTCICLLCWFTGCCGFVTNLFCSLLMWFSFFCSARSPKPQARCPMPDGRGPHFPSMCGLNLPKSFISSNLVLHLFDLLNLHTCIWAISVAGVKADCVRAERFRPQSLGINQCLWNSLNHAACNGEAWLMA